MVNSSSFTSGAVQQRPFIVGLTGGIASGKSTVSHYLTEKHAIPIIDTDIIARTLVEVGSPTLSIIAQHFGESIIDEQGHLKRRQLRDIISHNPEERLWLNALMHPRIYNQVVIDIKTLATASAAPYVMVIIPLLHADSPYLKLLNEIWVVDCDEAQQKQRLMLRDHINPQAAQRLIDAQPSRTERLALATAVILNDSDTNRLIEQTEEHHQHLMASLSAHKD